MNSFRLQGTNPNWRQANTGAVPMIVNLTIGKFYEKTPDSGIDFRDDVDVLRMWDAFLWEGLEAATFDTVPDEDKVLYNEVVTDGLKHDSGKVQMGLLFNGVPNALAGAADVLDFGAIKYEAHSWKGVKAERYLDAFYRHMTKAHMGETHDEDSGLPHIDHALTNLMFIRELMSEGQDPFGVPSE